MNIILASLKVIREIFLRLFPERGIFPEVETVAVDSSGTKPPGVDVIVPSIGNDDKVMRIIRGFKIRKVESEIDNLHLVVDPKYLSRCIKLANNFEWVSVSAYELPFSYSQAIYLGATISSNEHLLLVNDDVILNSSRLKLADMKSIIHANEVGLVGCLHTSKKTPNGISHGGISRRKGRLPRNIKSKSFRIYPEVDEIPVLSLDACSTAFAIVKKQFLISKGEDHIFPMGYSDVSLCNHIIANGSKVLVSLSNVIHHDEMTSRGKSPVNLVFDFIRSAFRYFRYLD